MTSDTSQDTFVHKGDPDILIRPPRIVPDFATILGIILTLTLIAAAIASGDHNARFIDPAAVMIVVLGTMAATSIAYTPSELAQVPGIIGNSLMRRIRQPREIARQLMNLAVLARKRGVLALSQRESELRKDPAIARAVQLVVDGYSSNDVEQILGHEIDALAERHRRAAGIMRRAAEIAPAMGLIGTLVGLVQMLSQLDDPSAIGPAMALALLTTFYGAIMGSIILSPLAAKLERNSDDETMIKNMILSAMLSITRQQNPRLLEVLLNSELPPEERIRYFD